MDPRDMDGPEFARWCIKSARGNPESRHFVGSDGAAGGPPLTTEAPAPAGDTLAVIGVEQALTCLEQGLEHQGLTESQVARLKRLALHPAAQAGGERSIHRLSVVDVARVCHEANRAYCLALGDSSQLEWSGAPDWQRQSAEHGVEFNLSHPYAPASASHEAWLEEKRAAGWTWGPVKDAERREHPCFLPYEELPPEQRRKDALFQAICRALLGGEG